MKIKGIVIAFCIGLTMIGCSMPKTYDETMIAGAEASVSSALKDPQSAQFTDVHIFDGPMICGMVNAKNSFGGYVGPRRFFVYMTGHDGIDVIWSAPVIADDQATTDMLNGFCSGRSKE